MKKKVLKKNHNRTRRSTRQTNFPKQEKTDVNKRLFTPPALKPQIRPRADLVTKVVSSGGTRRMRELPPAWFK